MAKKKIEYLSIQIEGHEQFIQIHKKFYDTFMRKLRKLTITSYTANEQGLEVKYLNEQNKECCVLFKDQKDQK